jgi:sulfotransferase
MKFHFISGLPRSGSTLLASVLSQNPKFSAHIESPVGRMFTSLHTSMGVQNEAAQFITDDVRIRSLRGLFSAFYAENNADVVFDNNRRWCANLDLLATLYPDCKVLCCVRPASHIVDSLERLLRKHPLALSAIIGGDSNLTVYQRVNTYMSPDGVVGFALQALRTAWYGEHRHRIVLIRYDQFCRFPRETLDDIHEILGETQFNYDFEHISTLPGTQAFDERIGTPGLHDLKGSIVYEARTAVIPPDVFGSLPKPFWDPVKEEATKGE